MMYNNRPLDHVDPISPNATASAMNMYTEPTEKDVKLGKGKECFNHVGNRRFRALIGACCQRYHDCKARYGKRLVVIGVSQFLQRQNCRFIKFNKTSQKWYEATLKEGNEKIGHAIRDTINFRLGITSKHTNQDEKKGTRLDTAQGQLTMLDHNSEPSQLISWTTHARDDEEFEEDLLLMKKTLESFFDNEAYASRTFAKTEQYNTNLYLATTNSEVLERNSIPYVSDAGQEPTASHPKARASTPITKTRGYSHAVLPLQKRERQRSPPTSDGLQNLRLLSSASLPVYESIQVEDKGDESSPVSSDGDARLVLMVPSESEVDAVIGILSAMKRETEENAAAVLVTATNAITRNYDDGQQNGE